MAPASLPILRSIFMVAFSPPPQLLKLFPTIPSSQESRFSPSDHPQVLRCAVLQLNQPFELLNPPQGSHVRVTISQSNSTHSGYNVRIKIAYHMARSKVPEDIFLCRRPVSEYYAPDARMAAAVRITWTKLSTYSRRGKR